MAERAFHYRPVLTDLTTEAKEQGLDPFEAYARLYERQRREGLTPRDYLSTSITSGGHVRDDTLDMPEVIARNTRSAALLAEQLANDGQILPESAVEPVFVGKTGWNQAEYMEFWLSVIGGNDLKPGFFARDIDNLRRDARAEYDRVGLDMDLMLSSASPEDRAGEYFRMSNAFANLIARGTPATPMERVVRLIDPDKSLGGQAERAFARQIGTRVMNVCLVKPAQPEDLESVNPTLARDTARLIRFGAAVFDTANNSVRLVLEEHREAA